VSSLMSSSTSGSSETRQLRWSSSKLKTTVLMNSIMSEKGEPNSTLSRKRHETACTNSQSSPSAPTQPIRERRSVAAA